MGNNALVYTVDGDAGCFLQLVTSVNSVRRIHKYPLDIIVLTNDRKHWMDDLVTSGQVTEVLDVGEMAREWGLYDTGIVWRRHPVSPMLLFRILIPLVERLRRYEKVLYLDTDTELWDDSFFSIFDITGDKELTGVQDSLGRGSAIRRILELRGKTGDSWSSEPVFSRWNDLTEGTNGYINSGVLVFDMSKFDHAKYSARAKYLVRRLAEIKPKYPDQDLINVYFDINRIADRRFDAWGPVKGRAFLRHYVGFERKRSGTYPPVDAKRPNHDIESIAENSSIGVFSGIVDGIYLLEDKNNPECSVSLRKWLEDNGVRDFTSIDTAYTGRYDSLLENVKGRIRREHVDNIVAHYKACAYASAMGLSKIAVFEHDFIPHRLEKSIGNLKKNPDFDFASCLSRGEVSFIRRGRFAPSSSKGYILGKRGINVMRISLERMFSGDSSLEYVHSILDSDRMFKPRVMARS